MQRDSVKKQESIGAPALLAASSVLPWLILSPSEMCMFVF